MTEEKFPFLVLAVAPVEEVKLLDSFYEKENPFFNLLQNPPYLRYSGWNLRTLDIPRLKNGEYWEVKNKDRKLIRFYNDGSFLTSASVDKDFLSWTSKENNLSLHALATIEYVYEFVEFYKKCIEFMKESSAVFTSLKFKIGIKNIDKLEGKKLLIRPYEVGTYEFQFEGWGESFSLESDFIKEIDLVKLSENIYDSKYIAYKLIAILFRQFGVTVTPYPYVLVDEKGEKFINTEKIKSI
jgi:hypothetical protein